MLFGNYPILLRGGGDLATGVAYRLHHAGFPVIVTELPRPLVVRRRVALATAVLEGEITVESLRAVRVETPPEAWTLAATGVVPVLVSAGIPDQWTADRRPPTADEGSLTAVVHRPSAIVDARMAKRNIDTSIDQAPLVVALGPGFTAGVDCHAVIETNRGHRLGGVMWRGPADPSPGTPAIAAGNGPERVSRAPAEGATSWRVDIGDRVRERQIMGDVAGQPVVAPFDGVVRGLIAPGTSVPAGLKIGDVDPREDASAAFTISEKALAIGGGVLEAILIHLNQTGAPPE